MSKEIPVTIESTSDTPEQVQAALGKKAVEPKETKETKPATEAKPPVETKEASGASKTDDSEPEVQGDPADEQRPDKKGGVQKRIDKLTRKNSEFERENLQMKLELERMRAAQKPSEAKEPPKESKPESAAGKPKKEEFKTHEEYNEALTDWKVDQKLHAEKARERETIVKAEMEKQKSTHLDRVKEFRKTAADFDDVMEEISDVRLSLAVQNAILESENGPELMYQFAKNPDEFARINGLPPGKAEREIGRFEAGFKRAESSEPKPEVEVETKPQTKAPAPMKPVGSKASNPKTIRDELPYEDWVKIRREEIRASRGR